MRRDHRGRWARTAAACGTLLAWAATTAAVPAALGVPQVQHPLRTAQPGPGTASAAVATPGPVGYIPCDVAHAYGLNPMGLDGAGVTIAIIVASDEPNIQTDVRSFDSAFGLLDPPIINVSAPFGHTANVDPSWPAEIALDVEWAHAAVPGATIDVVEAATDQLQNPPSSELLATTLWAVKNLNPDVVVLPWGAPESVFASFYGSGFEAQFNTQFFPATNGAGRPVTYLADAGDSGFGTNWPAVATTVVGVGGTSLAPQAFGYGSMPGSHLDCSGASASFGVNQTNETVWGSAGCAASPCVGTGGGPSAFEAKPAWQVGFGPGSNRIEPDVAMLADPRSGVATYQNGQFNQSLLGGNGLSASLWAGVVATMDQELRLRGLPSLSVSGTSSWVYSAQAADFNDIVTGSSPPAPNDPCLASGACVAGPGYDQVTGRGSPHVPALVADVAGPVAPQPPPPTRSPLQAVESWSANRLDIFYRGADNALWHTCWNGTAWCANESKGGSMAGPPTVVSWAADRLDVFYRGTDNGLWHIAWDTDHWGTLEPRGGSLAGDPVVESWGPSRLDIFYRGTDDALWHTCWQGSSWCIHESRGGSMAGPPTVVSWAANRLDIFYRGSDGALWHTAWDTDHWGGQEQRGGTLTSDPAVESWGSNRLDIFYRGADNALWHTCWNGTAWCAHEPKGGSMAGPPTVVSWAANRLDVFYRGTDNGLWHIAWDTDHWGGQEQRAGVLTGEPTVEAWGFNRLDIFYRGADNALWHTCWNGSSWCIHESLGGTVT